MSDQPILQSLDADVLGHMISRRDAFTKATAASVSALAVFRAVSVPIGIAAMARSAFADGGLPSQVVDVLNFALTLEYLESEFYARGYEMPGLIPASDRAIFSTIRQHEKAHVRYLRATLGAKAVAKPKFDYTAGGGSGKGPYVGVFAVYATFQAVAQAFEDTGVRAYKGQAPALQPYDAYLTAALTIHSVEARHASEVRRLRGQFSEQAPNKGWITRNLTDVPGTAAVYAGEEVTVQGGVDIPAVSGVSIDAATEAFDQPLSKAEVLAIVAPFIDTKNG